MLSAGLAALTSGSKTFLAQRDSPYKRAVTPALPRSARIMPRRNQHAWRAHGSGGMGLDHGAAKYRSQTRGDLRRSPLATIADLLAQRRSPSRPSMRLDQWRALCSGTALRFVEKARPSVHCAFGIEQRVGHECLWQVFCSLRCRFAVMHRRARMRSSYA